MSKVTMRRRALSLTAPPLKTTFGRVLLITTILFFITLAIVFTPRSTLKPHITGGYPYTKPPTPQINTPIPDPSSANNNPPPARLIVKVQLPGEDLTWLLKLLPDWRNQVITLDDAFARLHVGAQRVDRGRIAAAYLEWIITHYASLSETMVFVGPGLEQQKAASKSAWAWIPGKELVSSIQTLQVPYVVEKGYAPLRCPARVACEDLAVRPFREPKDEYRTMEVKMAKAWEGLFNNTEVPEMLAGPGGSEFAVSGAQVRRRSVEEYTRMWEWVATTKMDDESAGAVVERLWHVIFGRESVWCPAEEECRCDVFGMC